MCMACGRGSSPPAVSSTAEGHLGAAGRGSGVPELADLSLRLYWVTAHACAQGGVLMLVLSVHCYLGVLMSLVLS